jgi:hypothetical protein
MTIPGWQQDILNKMHSEFKPGEMQIVSVGRGAGKSRWPIRLVVPYRVLGGATLCDDGPWYQVYCRPDVAAWVRTQDPMTWMETGSHASLGNFFDIRDSVMVMLALKWA